MSNNVTKIGVRDRASADVISRPQGVGGITIGGIMTFDCFRPKTERDRVVSIRKNRMEKRAGRAGAKLGFRRWLDRAFPHESVLAWSESAHNIWVNVGLDETLQRILKSSSYSSADFVALKDTGTPIAANTMGTHSEWATITPYSNATDPAYVLGSVSGQSVDNSASVAAFNINATDEVFGAFLKDNNTKGGTSGILLCVVDFAASRNVESGDTLNVTYTITSADDGA